MQIKVRKNTPAEDSEGQNHGNLVSGKSHVLLGDQYEILSPEKHTKILGKGTYGTVYLVQDVMSQRRYACKMETTTTCLHEEIAFLKLFQHQNILPVLQSQVAVGGLSWMVMPLMQGNLHAHVHLGTVDADSQKALFCQMMAGLGHVHGHNIVHADLKPGNILVDLQRQHYCIADFGMAYRLPLAEEHRHSPAYTYCYRPPELCSPDADLCLLLNFKSDSWAAGQTMLEAAWGKRFFVGDTKAAVLDQIQKFAEETSIGLGGPLLKKLREAMSHLPLSLRKPVSQLLKSSNKSRALCSRLAGARLS
eukprot:Skav219224  [mRNA]  locus=scaffold2965:6369:7286:+ [translate_table: standard]